MLDSPLHEHHLLKYEVTLSNEPYLSFESTAVISFFYENNKKVMMFKYGVLTEEAIFKKIDNNEALNFNNAYIKNFSLTNYRTNKGFDDHVHIPLKNFSAK